MPGRSIPFSGLVIRRPNTVRGGRGWQQRVRGDGSGKRYTKHSFNNDLLIPYLIGNNNDYLHETQDFVVASDRVPDRF